MIIKEFRKIGLIIALLFIVGIMIATKKYEYAICYILGVLVSNINLTLNDKFFDISGSKSGITRNLSNYLLRIVLYAFVMILSIKWMNVEGLICTFLGCMNIRIAILIYGIKGGIKDEYSK
ncbi:ATP synthase subunit I [Mycoplasma sp. P36-A1]|uniref:ATP synthase subunit I n=1 Tax=Mycoplasma sp. P36-A1 TaxID=3252900 RepID=UPI003C2B6E9E